MSSQKKVSQNPWKVVNRSSHSQAPPGFVKNQGHHLQHQHQQQQQQQQQQRKIESLLTQMAKLELQNNELKDQIQSKDNLLAQTAQDSKIIAKQLLAEEKVMEDIQMKEVNVLKNSIEFLKTISTFVSTTGYQVGLFGSLVRRVMEPRSRTMAEHEIFMSEFSKSDIDICIFSSESPPHLEDILQKMFDMGSISEIHVIKYKKFMSRVLVEQIVHERGTEYMKLTLKFKGTTFALDLFNRKPTSEFFGGRDFSCNLLQIHEVGSCSISLPIEYTKPFAILDTMLEIGTKTAHSLFSTEKCDLVNFHIARRMSKMASRQEKLVRTGYKIPTKILTSTFSTSNEGCCICRETMAEKIQADQLVPDNYCYIASCLCKEGRNLCQTCLERLLSEGDYRCPICRKTLQVHFENEEKELTPSLFPEMTILREVLDEENFGVAHTRELTFDAQELALLDARARAAALYDDVWPPRF